MVINLTGTLFTGQGRPGYSAPDSYQPLKVPSGEAVTVQVRLVTSAGVPVDLSLGTPVFSLTVKASPLDQRPLIQKAGTLQPLLGKNAVSFQIDPADTRLLLGSYFWNLWLANGSARDQIFAVAAFQVLPSLTPPG